MVATIALLLLVCSGGSALSPQEDCGNDNVQTAWLFNNTPLACVRAFNEIYLDDFLTQDNVEHVKTICSNADCGQKFVDWLQGPQCREQTGARRTAVDFSRTVCASFNGSVEGNCLFSESADRVDEVTTDAIFQNCARWWLGTAQGACPSDECASALQTAVNRVQCCYNNYFSTKYNVDFVTTVFQYYSGIEGAKGVPYVNLTEPALLSACNVTNPGTCKTQLTVTVTTEASLGAADCSNYNMQNAWFFSNTPLICRRANNGLFNNSDDGTLPNVNNIKTICNNDDCGQKLVNWLRGPECRDQPGTEQIALDFSQITCSSFNGSAEGSCLFTASTGHVDNAAIKYILQNCSEWWLGSAKGACPSNECSSVLQTAVDEAQCCYNSYFGSKLLVYLITNLFQSLNITGAMGVPNVDITDPALLSACKVPNPGTCQSQLAITGASLSTAASMAVAVAGMLATVALQ